MFTRFMVHMNDGTTAVVVAICTLQELEVIFKQPIIHDGLGNAQSIAENCYNSTVPIDWIHFDDGFQSSRS